MVKQLRRNLHLRKAFILSNTLIEAYFDHRTFDSGNWLLKCGYISYTRYIFGLFRDIFIISVVYQSMTRQRSLVSMIMPTSHSHRMRRLIFYMEYWPCSPRVPLAPGNLVKRLVTNPYDFYIDFFGAINCCIKMIPEWLYHMVWARNFYQT